MLQQVMTAPGVIEFNEVPVPEVKPCLLYTSKRPCLWQKSPAWISYLLKAR